MKVCKKEFPKDIEDKIKKNINKSKVEMSFINGADVFAENTNIRFVEPYKVLFSSRNVKPKKIVLALIFDNYNGKPIIFINEIGEHNKVSMTKLIQLVTKSL